MRVFISYRRADFGGFGELVVGRIRDNIAAKLNKSNVFMDLESIPIGVDFEQFVDREISKTDAVIVVIGPNWHDELAKRLLAQNDYVRAEIKSALARKKVIIPLLIGGSSMPDGASLPNDLNQLASHNALSIPSAQNFGEHINALVANIEERLTFQTIALGEYIATVKLERSGNVKKYRMRKSSGSQLTFSDVLEGWRDDASFREFFISLLRDSEFPNYLWETPCVNSKTVHQSFEFVLLKLPLSSASPDRDTYGDYFDINAGDHGVVVFDNLGKDARLVVPSPPTESIDYSSLSRFIEFAPKEQQHAIWRSLANDTIPKLSNQYVWMSVAGGGIPWLHLRVDTEPKYYRYEEYAAPP